MWTWIKSLFRQNPSPKLVYYSPPPNVLAVPTMIEYPARQVVFILEHPHVYEEPFVPLVNQALTEYAEKNKSGMVSTFKSSNGVYVRAIPVDTINAPNYPNFGEVEEQEEDR